MPITPEFAELINRLNQELNQTEQQTAKGLNLARDLLSRFPNNAILIQEFAYLNVVSLFTEASRRQIRTAVETVSSADIPDEIIQETGEGLGNLLGRILEARLRVERFIKFLER